MNRIAHGVILTAKAKIVLVVVVSILCAGDRAPAKDPGNSLEKKQGKERANSFAKEPILMMERALLHYTNEERGRRKLPSLRLSTGLQFLARGQSANMCEIRNLQHESDKFPQGWRNFAGRLKIVGLTAGGENIAFRTVAEEPHLWAKEVIKGWMNSAEHRKNILSPKFTYVGIGVAPCARRIVYAAQVFSIEPGRVPQTRK